MENSTKSPLSKGNLFTKVFVEFDEEAFFSNLHERVKDKSYFEKYRGFKTTILALSYLFNIASAITASYAIFWLTKWITGLAILGYIVATVFLFFLEQIKRKSSSEFWQVYFFRKQIALGWLGLSLFCLALSLMSSGFGVKRSTENLSPSPELIAADSTLKYYYAEIKRIESVNKDLRSNKNREGITFYSLYPSLNKNTETIAEYRKEAQSLEKKLAGKNDKLTTSYMEEVELTAWTLVAITLLMELLFEGCIAYVWYYYYRSYVERVIHTNNAQSTQFVQTKNPQITPNLQSPTLSELQNTIQLLQAENQVLLEEQEITLPPSLFSEKTNNEAVLNTSIKNEHTRTHEDTPTKPLTDDRYTIPHTYKKGGKTTTVHYNATMVKSRVGEYERKIKEAETKKMDKNVLENRRQWLMYWKQKEAALYKKMEAKEKNTTSAQ